VVPQESSRNAAENTPRVVGAGFLLQPEGVKVATATKEVLDMSNLMAVVCLTLNRCADPLGLQNFKACLSACPSVESSLEVTGTYDLILKVCLASLEEYQFHLDRMAPQIRNYVARLDTNFVCRASEKKAADSSIWVPCSDGHRRLNLHQVVKITAEGDYMRIYTDSASYLVHDTLQHIVGQLDNDSFVRLHRSCVVRCACVDRVIHHTRSWVARLKDGSEQRVSKSRVSQVMQKLGLTNPGAVSSTTGPITEQLLKVNELRMHSLQR
jgi:DNA-binding Lrp family transcriptional regulator